MPLGRQGGLGFLLALRDEYLHGKHGAVKEWEMANHRKIQSQEFGVLGWLAKCIVSIAQRVSGAVAAILPG